MAATDVRDYYFRIRLLRCALAEYVMTTTSWNSLLRSEDELFVERLFFWAAGMDTANGIKKVHTHHMTKARMLRCNRVWEVVKNHYDDTDFHYRTERDAELIHEIVTLLSTSIVQNKYLSAELVD